MQGITNTWKLNSKQDFENNYQARLANGESDPLIDYRLIYSCMDNWFNETTTEEQMIMDPITEIEVATQVEVPIIVENIEAGVTDATHRIINGGSEEEPVFYQQILRYDNNCYAALKGFTPAELESILGL